MLPLLLCSLIALTIIIERLFWGPRHSKVIPPELLSEIKSLLSARRFEELFGLCRSQNNPCARIVTLALANSDRPRAEIIEAVQSLGKQISIELQRYLSVLGTIAAVSPLLGLLGTVFGMIEVFTVIESMGLGQATALAGGIAEALITTAVGLCIAIPVLIFYRFFVQKTRALIVELEALALDVIDRIGSSAPAEGFRADKEDNHTSAGGAAASAASKIKAAT